MGVNTGKVTAELGEGGGGGSTQVRWGSKCKMTANIRCTMTWVTKTMKTGQGKRVSTFTPLRDRSSWGRRGQTPA